MNVTLYSTHCPRCIVLEKKLNAKNINFKIVTDEDIIIEKGFMSVPMLEVDGSIYDFSKAIKWVNEIGESDD